MGERGLVIGIDLEFDRGTGFSGAGTHQDAFRQNLRRWSLFWDRLLVATNPNSIGRSSHEIDFLASNGLVKFLSVQHHGGEVGQVIHDINVSAAYWLEEKEPGSWAIDRSEGSLFCPNDSFFAKGQVLEQRGLLVELQNVIPVPDKDVPLHDILEFKEKRRTEMLALRHHVDGLYQNIGKATDQAHAVKANLDVLSAAVDDAIRVMRERRLPFRMSSELANINFVGGMAAAVPLIIAQAPLITVLANAVSSAIFVGAGIKWLGRKKVGSPFQYVVSYHKEIF